MFRGRAGPIKAAGARSSLAPQTVGVRQPQTLFSRRPLTPPRPKHCRRAPKSSTAATTRSSSNGTPTPPPPPPRGPRTGGGGGGGGGGNDDDDARTPNPNNKSLLPGTLAALAFATLAGWAAWDTLPTAGVDESAVDAGLSIIIPCLNESAAIEQTLALVAGGGGSGGGGGGSGDKTSLSPAPLEIIVVDGGSTDGTPDLAERYAKRHNREVDRLEKEQRQRQQQRRRNDDEEQQQPAQPPLPPRIQILRLNRRGRAVQMNAGAAAARAPLLAFLHADTQPPLDLVAAARRWFLDRRNVALGFVPSIEVDEEWMERSKRRRRRSNAPAAAENDNNSRRKTHLLVAQSAHNTVKTLFYPALLRPLSFLRGLRLLFGDQVIVVRRADLERVGGFDERYRIMEDADLCLRLHKAGPYLGRTEVAAKQQKTKKPPSEIEQSRLALSAWQNQTTEQAFQSAKWTHPRGRVRMDCRRLARTSGRRLAAWGFLRGSITNFRIASAWYFWHSPERVADLYRRLYTDAYR